MVGRAFSLLYIDVDRLASINERFGYAFGDRVLGQLWDRLRAACRREGGLVRLCGDEFILMLESGDTALAASIAQRMLLHAREPMRVGSALLEASVSIGGALYPRHGEDIHILMNSAQAALRQAKAEGPGGFRMYRAAAGGPSEALPGLLGDLDGAVRRREFRLQYQPQVSALDGRTTGAESLLRWQHPQLGMISPDRFIELLEQSRLIVPLGAWILEESCRQLADWRRAGADWTISVNISSTQLLDPDFPAMVRAVLDRHGLPPQALTLELTETIGMQDPGATIPRLRQLSDLGVGISIDDFGTGYSSLLYLSTLPATELKIDRGFVRRLWEDSNDAYIVSTIVALGHALDLTVVAEGVESEEQRLFLSSVGCDVLQGYHLGVPLRPEHFWAQFGG